MATTRTLREVVRRAALRTGLGLTVGMLTGGMLSVTGVAAMGDLLAQPDNAITEGAERVARQAARVQRLSERYDCSRTGLGPHVIPARTIVLVRDHVRLATFDEGWAIHEGVERGTLVAVCAR